ncbi:MAG: ABC transporter substrate-binding protein [Chloroflexi bacterium]|nr:ABC transporter substrate-binding protein [Chloroflexota bacterium]
MKRLLIALVAVLLLMLSLLVACSSGDGENPSSVPESTTVTESVPDVVVTIGNITDITGLASNAMSPINKGLDDIVRHYNDQNLIPGVTLKVIHYDGQYDPAKDIPGYHWLKEQGVDFLFTTVGSAVGTLKPLLEKDGMVMFTVSPSKKDVDPGGPIFAPGSPFHEDLAYSLLYYLPEIDPYFPQDRPAKIGGAMWAEAAGISTLAGAEVYATTHPEQYEWVGTHLPYMTFIWGPEVEALKDCDYVIPPALLNQFVKEYRDAEYTAKLVGTHSHDAFIGLLAKANLWDQADGTIFLRASELWDQDTLTVNLMKELLQKYRTPSEAEEIRRSGSGYLTGYNFHIMLELIADAVELAGPEGFGAEAIYEAAESFTLEIDGIEREAFSDTRRISINYLVPYELRAAEKDEFRVGTEWYPLIHMPDD